jgi:F-type H+-transporting ATPase subunit b
MKNFHNAIVKVALSAALCMMLTGVASTCMQAQEAAQSPRSSDVKDSGNRESQPPSQEAGRDSSEAKHEEQSSEEEEVRHSPVIRSIAAKTGLSVDQVYWICVAINFSIVLFAVVYGLRKKLPGLFKSRTEAIQKHIEEARRTGEEARRRLAEVESCLSRLDAEIEAMRRQAEENARAEDHRILSESEQERRRIVEAAEQEIAMAASAARRELQGYAAELAVDLAGKKIRVAPDTDQVLVRDFTSWLGKDGN